MHRLGHTRSASQPDHRLQTPDTFVRASLPHLEKGHAIVHASPAHGAAFTMYTAELQSGGILRSCAQQRLVFVVNGTAQHLGVQLHPGSFLYLPEHDGSTLTAVSPAHLVVIQKPYVSLPQQPAPGQVVSHVDHLLSSPLDPASPTIELRSLLPDDPAHDFAVNLLTYPPGAALPQVEIHVMEHGLLMLAGGGIYRLGEHWYPVTKGDFIYMAPFCPQWFGCIGQTPATYLIYKDTNRLPA